MANSCVIRSITLEKGEQFTLPSSATLLGADNSNNITSTCDLPTLEALGCYVALIGSYKSGSGEDGYWEADGSRIAITGIELNGSEKLFQTAEVGNSFNFYGCLNGYSIANKIKTIIPGIVDIAGGNDQESGSAGALGNCLTYVLIKTIPSLANNMRLIVQGTGPISGGGNEIVKNTTKFIPLDTLISEGYNDLPSCPS